MVLDLGWCGTSMIVERCEYNYILYVLSSCITITNLLSFVGIVGRCWRSQGHGRKHKIISY